MALFKSLRGKRENLPSTKTDGYAYFCTDDGTFWIDYKDENNVVQRKQINAKDAETLMGASISTILNSSDVEIPTSKAVLDALVGKVPDGGITGQVLKKTETGTEWADESCAADAVQSNLDTHVNNTTIHVTAEEKAAWNKSILLDNISVTLPISTSWSRITYGSGKFVAISGNNSSSNIYAYSENCISWSQSTLPYSKQWSDLSYGNGKFVAVAYNSNTFIYSADGINWSSSTLPSSAGWRLTYGNGMFVAVGANSAIYSTDGISWSSSTLPVSTSWTDITYGNGKFVAIGNNLNMIYSTDGISWTQSSLPVSTYWMSVAYGNGKFVTVSLMGGYCAYSTDGINWSSSTLPSSDGWFSVAYGNGKFVAVKQKSSIIAYSNDGITWTTATLPVSASWNYVNYCDNRFIALASGTNYVAYSKDGINWSDSVLTFQTVSGTDVTDDTKVILGLDKPITPESIGAATMDEVNSAIQTAIGNAIGGSY